MRTPAPQRLSGLLLLAFFVNSPSARALETVDRFAQSDVRIELPKLKGPIAARIAAGRISGREPRLGVPTFFWAGVNEGPSPRSLGQDTPRAALLHLRAYASLYRLPQTLPDAVQLRRVHDTGEGAIIVELIARVRGAPVFRESLKVIMDRELRLVALSGYLSPHLSAAQEPHELSATAALAAAALDLRGELHPPHTWQDLGAKAGGYRAFALPNGTQSRARKVYYDLPGGLQPAFHLELDDHTYVISARDGKPLFRDRLLSTDHIYSVYAEPSFPHRPEDNPLQNISPHPTGAPTPLSPPALSANRIDLGFGPISTQDPWLQEGATESSGNNVQAYADLASPDGFSIGDVYAHAELGRSFIYSYEPSAHPQANEAQTQAAVVNLFYVTNHLHNEFYDAGFDETWGNAQQHNYGRGGLEGDPLKAEAQDHAGFNNANMLTPADGAPPRMQMFLFSGVQSAQAHLHYDTKQSETPLTEYAHFGPQQFNVESELELVDDSSADPRQGCERAWAQPLTDRIAVMLRGGCDYTEKVQNAQNHGALGAIIVDDQDLPLAPRLTGFSPDISIPAVGIRAVAGRALLEALEAGAAIRANLVGRPPAPVDAAMDNTIVAHEWGHYISSRLIGDASGLFNSQGRALGEGWADFHALLLMVREQDDFQGAFAVGTYASQSPYFGLRRVPYSTDLSINALRFRHIQNGVELPEVPSAFGQTGEQNAEPHNAGEVWATMLWECYAALLNAPQLSEAQARTRMLSYLVAAYKITPIAPTFIEARDALLAAARASSRQDFDRFAQAFARRGAGFGARAPERFSQTHEGVVESEASGTSLKIVDMQLDDDTARYCDKDGWLDRGEIGRLKITVENIGWAPLRNSSVTVRSPNQEVFFPQGAALQLAPTRPGERVEVSLPIGLQGEVQLQQIQLIASALDPEQTAPASLDVVFRFPVNLDEVPKASYVDSADTPSSAWQMVGEAGEPFSRTFEIDNWIWWGPSHASVSDRALVSPPLRAQSGFAIEFDHRFFLETGFDGAVIELSTDGQTWVDAGEHLTPGYDVELPSIYGSPLAGRKAFSGVSEGFPEWTHVRADLGRYAGQTVQIRFRLGTDELVSWWGWALDNIEVQGVASAPFPSLRPDAAQCINRPPIAATAGQLVVMEGEEIPLDTSRSEDLDGDLLSFTWIQVSGPSVVEDGPRWLAPQVSSSVELQLELLASDAQLSSAPSTLVVHVQDRNEAPRAFVGENLTVRPKSQVTLQGRGEDPNSDPLTFSWRQTSGPKVELSDASRPDPSFVAPKTTAQMLSFALVVSDGENRSAPVEVKVKIQENQAPRLSLPSAVEALIDTEVEVPASALDPDGDRLEYRWIQTAGDKVTFDREGDALRFMAPARAQTMEFQLTVWDGFVTVEQSTRITVREEASLWVEATRRHRVVERSEVQLHATPVAQGVPNIQMRWRQTQGLTVALQDADTMSPSFIAPEVAQTQELRFEVFAFSQGLQSLPVVVKVLVDHQNRPPVVNTRFPQTVKGGELVTLLAEAQDPDQDRLEYGWRQTFGPEVKLNPLDAPAPSFIAPRVSSDRQLTFAVTVTDGIQVTERTVEVMILAPSKGCVCVRSPNGRGPALVLLLLALFVLPRIKR